jgi:hypothetical protein
VIFPSIDALFVLVIFNNGVFSKKIKKSIFRYYDLLYKVSRRCIDWQTAHPDHVHHSVTSNGTFYPMGYCLSSVACMIEKKFIMGMVIKCLTLTSLFY